MIDEGYDAIAKALARGIDIRLNHVVQRVIYRKDGVRVETKQEAFSGDRAIVTLPLGILKLGKVLFEPLLPKRKEQAIQNLGMGVLNKIVLRFPNAFWQPESDFLGYLSSRGNDSPLILNLLPYLHSPILTAFLGGAIAREQEKQSDEQLTAHLLRELRYMFPRSVLEPTGILVTRWASNAFSCGSYSFETLQKPDEQQKESAETNRETSNQEATTRFFQAVGIIEGEVSFDEQGQAKVTVSGKTYPLLYIPKQKYKLLALQKHIRETGNPVKRLIVYPRAIHFPDKNKPQQIQFQLPGLLKITPLK